jgi:hypothetical protein
MSLFELFLDVILLVWIYEGSWEGSRGYESFGELAEWVSRGVASETGENLEVIRRVSC